MLKWIEHVYRKGGYIITMINPGNEFRYHDNINPPFFMFVAHTFMPSHLIEQFIRLGGKKVLQGH